MIDWFQSDSCDNWSSLAKQTALSVYVYVWCVWGNRNGRRGGDVNGSTGKEKERPNPCNPCWYSPSRCGERRKERTEQEKDDFVFSQMHVLIELSGELCSLLLSLLFFCHHHSHHILPRFISFVLFLFDSFLSFLCYPLLPFSFFLSVSVYLSVSIYPSFVVLLLFALGLWIARYWYHWYGTVCLSVFVISFLLMLLLRPAFPLFLSRSCWLSVFLLLALFSFSLRVFLAFVFWVILSPYVCMYVCMYSVFLFTVCMLVFHPS